MRGQICPPGPTWPTIEGAKNFSVNVPNILRSVLQDGLSSAEESVGSDTVTVNV